MMVYGQSLCFSLIVSIILTQFSHPISSQLVVNVKNKGEDVEKEHIEANTTADTVTLEFLSKDGTRVTQFIDYKSDLQIFRIYVPWEEERGLVQNKPQALCFVARFGKNEFISSDAMSKLRQKNPTAIRSPEEDKGFEKYRLNLLVNLNQANSLSPHISNFCQDAVESTYAVDADVKLISQLRNKDVSVVMSAMKNTDLEKYTRCKDTSDITKPCQCQYQTCIGWYPCGLKYCKGKDSTGRVVNYRCGIKTCRRCLLFEHFAKQKMFCLWDDL